jgi:hypothetical protein
LDARVVGVNPIKITCDDLAVRRGLALNGSMITRFIAINGSITDTAIRFLYGTPGTGIYSPAIDRINISIAGTDVCRFSPLGLGVTNIFSPTGTIDFGGAALTGVASITPNPRAYELVGIATPTTGAVTASALNIPLVPTLGASATWELLVKVIFALDGSGGAQSGIHTFRARAYVSSGGSTTPTVTAQYDITRYENPALAGVAIALAPIAGSVNVAATGLAGVTIVWQAKCDVIKVESA